MKKRILSCFMALALCLTLLPTAALAADGAQAADGTGHTHTGAIELRMDDKTLKKDGQEWAAESIEVWGTSDADKKPAYALTTGTYYLGNDIEITQYPIMITGNVTLCLNGKKITCGSPAPDCVIGVYANTDSALTLTDCKNGGETAGEIKGGKNYGVKVYKGYTLNMHGGTIIGGVDMSGDTKSPTPTKFNMSGGTITGGGIGVRLTQYCEFTMSGGTISNNKGGVSMGGGKFEMSGTAKITGNKATRDGGGVYVSGGTFIMNGGEIKSNTANTAGGGVFVQNGTFTVSGTPIVSENTSGSEENKVTDNVCLYPNKTITIGSGLTNGTDIGVTTGSAMAPTEDSTIAIATATSNANGYLSYFNSDNDSYEIVTNEQNTQLELRAKPRTSLSSAKVTLDQDSFVFDSNSHTPTVTGVMLGVTELTKNTDYTVSVSPATNAGDYTLTVEGTGKYKDSVEKKWKITPLTVGVSSVTLSDKVYDGTTAGSSSDVARVTFKKGSSDSDIMTLQKEDYTIKSVTYTDANVTKKEQNVDVEVTLQNSNYTFGNTQTTQVTTQGKIAKASADNLTAQTGTINVVNNEKKNYTLNLNELLPKLSGVCKYGEITYSLDKRTFVLGKYDGGTMIISNDGKDGKLTLQIADANDKKVGETICEGKVTVKTQNYKDFTLTINVKVVAAPLKDPEYTPPTAKTPTYNGQAQALITEGTAKNGTMQYCLSKTGKYSTEIPMATNAGDYTVYYKVVGDSGYSNTAVQSILVHINKAKPTGEPIYTKITAAKKTLKDAALERNTSWPTGTVKWELPDTTEVKADTAYKWIFTPKDSANYETLTGTVVLYTKSTPVTPSQPGGGGSSSSSVTTVKTNTVTNPDGSVTKTETKSDGTVVATTTAKDGSTSKTETKKDGSSVTESKNANGSTGTVKTDKNGQTTAETTLSSKAIEDAKKNGEAVKAPVEVEATRNSNTAPTVKIELPRNSGETKVEIPVTNVKPGTVAVLVHPDGTEEIVKNSLPTADGIQLTVDGGATVKIVDNSKDFIDTQNHWAKDAIDFVSARGLVNGMSATIYAPNASATRAQLWTILARQNDADLTGGNTWYEKAQLWSKDKGISDGTQPDTAISRAQMVTMLWRTMGQPAAASGASFADVPADSYYAQAVAWAVENGITAGVGGGRFDPNSTCTRAQIATFLARSMK